ncbi:MAG TPA: heterodisulfide reductase-related iron-sulfur binding cluster [Candidatus Lokiarchaeia archaeon]|nr:heterodisulfide reductase-related iron-sulfur binding cluster [Candidatus Lokiarchaeia archaeon]
MSAKRLEEYKRDLYRCIHCKACKFSYSDDPSRKGPGEYKGILYEGMLKSCPSGINYEWEGYWNAGRVWIARGLLEGTLKPSEAVRDAIYPCNTCGNCSVQCENWIDTVGIIEAVRATLIDAGIPLQDKHALVKQFTVDNNNPYGKPAEARMDWAKNDEDLAPMLDKEDVTTAYFTGCTASYNQTSIATATTKILKKLGYDFAIRTDEVCCGSPFFRVGEVDFAKGLMNKNLENFGGYETVIYSCAGCYRTMQVDYKKHTKKDLPFKGVHAMEIVAQAITDGKITIKSHPDLQGKTFTYHDPCHIGRHIFLERKKALLETSKNMFLDSRNVKKIKAEWFSIPRTILNAIAEANDAKFVEFYRNQEESFCCGAGGGVRSQYPDFSLKTASLRLDEAEAVGAEIVTTECPFCWRNLTDANDKFKHGLKVMGILEMLDQLDLIEYT